jgi:hypothetical protein
MVDLDRARPIGHATGEAGAFTSSHESSLHHGFRLDVPARYLLSHVRIGESASLDVAHTACPTCHFDDRRAALLWRLPALMVCSTR